VVPKRQQEVIDERIEGRKGDAVTCAVTLQGQRDLVFVCHRMSFAMLQSA